MYSISDLTQEIETVIENMDKRSRLHPDWITQAIMSNHQDIDGEDGDFFLCVGRIQVREQVAKRLNRYKVKPEVDADRQLVLEGFERLQKRYLVKEKGEQVAIRVQDMTQIQFEEKIRELEAMGAGCFQHADELKRFRDQLKAA